MEKWTTPAPAAPAFVPLAAGFIGRKAIQVQEPAIDHTIHVLWFSPVSSYFIFGDQTSKPNGGERRDEERGGRHGSVCLPPAAVLSTAGVRSAVGLTN
jgi:xanthosine utilization system XapX-like protein